MVNDVYYTDISIEGGSVLLPFSSNPIPPVNGLAIFNSGDNFAWKKSNGFTGTLARTLTGDRSWTLPDASGTIALIGVNNLLDPLVIPSAPSLNVGLATPTEVTATTSTTGGGFPANTTYFFKVVAYNAAGGNSLPSSEVSIITGAGSTNSITVSFPVVVGADSYRIYRGSTSNGQNGYVAAATNTPISGTISRTITVTPQTNDSVPTQATGLVINIDGTNLIHPYLRVIGGSVHLRTNPSPGATVTGAARGTAAVDLQVGRSQVHQVASGHSAFLGAGNANTASGQESAGIGGGSNRVTGSGSAFIGGNFIFLSGGFSASLASSNGTASASYTAIRGAYPVANLHGQWAESVRMFAVPGDNQYSRLLWSITTTNTATDTELRLDGNGGSNYFVVANNSSQGFFLQVLARGIAGTNDNKSAYWRVDGLVVNNAGVITIPAANITTVHSDVPEWSIALSVVSTRLAISVMGDATSTVQWNAVMGHLMNIG